MLPVIGLWTWISRGTGHGGTAVSRALGYHLNSEAIMSKATKQLADPFHEGLKDIYFAEKKIVSALPKMAKAAESEELAAAFKKHINETEEHVMRLERVFELIDQKPHGKSCPGILGLLEEGQDVTKEYKESPALDAGLIAAAQAVEHYEISRYGTLMVWAQQLGMTEAATLLHQTLQEEVKTHALLTQLADKVIHREAQMA
jgi:ferritin-like metal-binding protein YciE